MDHSNQDRRTSRTNTPAGQLSNFQYESDYPQIPNLQPRDHDNDDNQEAAYLQELFRRGQQEQQPDYDAAVPGSGGADRQADVSFGDGSIVPNGGPDPPKPRGRGKGKGKANPAAGGAGGGTGTGGAGGTAGTGERKKRSRLACYSCKSELLWSPSREVGVP